MSQKILIADKSITIQKIVELTFQEEDFEVIAASNGKEALEKLEQVQPNIVLADISLPEIDGYELCRIIRQDPRYAKFSKLPIIFLAGIYETMDEQKSKYVQEKAKEVDSNGVITKPFDPQDLIQRVKQLAIPVEVPEERVREVEEIFQEEKIEEVPQEEVKGEETLLLSEDEKRYIMGMPAEKELSPEITEDIFAEEKEEKPIEAPSESETVLFQREEIEKEITAPSAKEGIEELFEEEKAAAPAEEKKGIFLGETEIHEEAPLLVEEEKAAESLGFGEDILGISEIEETIIEEQVKEMPEEAILEAEEPIKLEEIEEKPAEEPVVLREEDLAWEEAVDLKKESEVEAEEVPFAIEEQAEVPEEVAEISSKEVFQPSPAEEEKIPVAAISYKAAKIPSIDVIFTDEIINKIADKVVEKLSQKVLEEIAWQVVPDLAEKIIKQAVEKLKEKQ